MDPQEDMNKIYEHKSQFIQKQLKKQRDLEEKKRDDITKKPADKVKKTALNTLVRFDITDNNGYDNSSLAIYEEMKRKGVGADEEEFTNIISTA